MTVTEWGIVDLVVFVVGVAALVMISARSR
jgi:hypothetical protein